MLARHLSPTHLARTLSRPSLSSSLPRRSAPSIFLSASRTMASYTGLPPDRRPVVISGPSGVGKGTLIKMLFERHPDCFTLSVSHTTRQPRPGESHGEHYYFVDMAEFEALIEAQGFVEHAKFGGNRYGTSKKTIKDQTAKGRVVVLDIELEGVKQIKNSDISARYVFVAPPSEAELERRLRGRGTEKEDSVQKRLQTAKVELEAARVPGFHDRTIVNDDLEKAYAELEEFIYQEPPSPWADKSS